MEDIPGCIVAPGLPGPDQGVDWLSCRPILPMVKNVSSLDCLLLVACAKNPQTVKNTKNSRFSHSCIDSRTTLTQIGTPLDLGY